MKAEILKKLIERAKSIDVSDLNEADTRLQFINQILTHVLGWETEEFHAEEYVPGGDEKQWMDYHLKAGENIRLIVEAKRIGKTFYLSRAKKQRKVRLKYLRENHGPELAEVIEQAVRYCQATGTYAFVATNGQQWIASFSGWPGSPAERIDAMVFYDLEDIHSNLQEFIDCLSPVGISRQVLLSRVLEGDNLSPAFARSLNQAIRENPPVNKNYLAAPIEAIMRLCFDELTDDDHAEMLERCYVTNDLTECDFARLELFVGNTLPYKISGDRIDRSMQRSGRQSFSNAAQSKGEALLVLGKVGSGKSTFLQYALQRLRSDQTETQWVLLQLNLLNRTETGAKVFDHDRLIDDLSQELLVQASERYPHVNPFEWDVLKGIFSGDIQRELASMPPAKRETSEADSRIDALISKLRNRPSDHLRAFLKYLGRNRDIPATVVLDNVDRGTEEFERVIFLFAQALSRDSGTTTITALRDTTYFNAQRGGFLDVSQHVIFTISPPSFNEVVAKRFEYTRKRLEGDTALSRRLSRSMQGFPLDRVYDFVEIISDLVLRFNTDIQHAIQALAGTDVRAALALLRKFSSSANTDIERLFRENASRNYSQPIDMFLASVMRGNFARYSSHDSPITNIIQVDTQRVVSHFTAVRILQFLLARLSDPRSVDTPISSVVEALGASGQDVSNVLHVINHVGRQGMLLSRTRPEPPWAFDDMIRLSPSGQYYLKNLLYSREYIKNVVDDTIVYDAEVHRAIRWVHENRELTWPQRNDQKMQTFLAYLYGREQLELTRAGRATERPTWLYPIVESIVERLLGHDALRSMASTPAVGQSRVDRVQSSATQSSPSSKKKRGGRGGKNRPRR